MSKRDYILRYILIIKKLRYSKKANFEEINNFLKTSPEAVDHNLSISKRTFQRDLDEINSIFEIEIKYSTKEQAYFIAEEHPSLKNGYRLLETIEILNGINLAGNLSPFLYPEQRKPLGTENMYGLLHAIQNNFLIEYSYLKYWEGEQTQRIVEPYALKEFKGRWYLIARDRKDNFVKTFGLDRISELNISSKIFNKTESINVYDMFRHSFGITAPTESDPEEVVLAFPYEQGQYIKSYPLHHSQKLVSENEKGIQIKLYVHITYELIMELLSYGDEVEIISPKKLRKDIVEIYKRAINKNNS